MDPIQRLRRAVPRSRRAVPRLLLDAVALCALPLAALLGAACGGKVVVDGDQGGNGGDDGTGGAGGSTGSSGSSGLSSATAGCSLTSSGTGGTSIQLTECIGQVNKKCPSQYQATMYLVPSASCSYVVSVDCGPFEQLSMCCYLVTEETGGCPH